MLALFFCDDIVAAGDMVVVFCSFLTHSLSLSCVFLNKIATASESMCVCRVIIYIFRNGCYMRGCYGHSPLDSHEKSEKRRAHSEHTCAAV